MYTDARYLNVCEICGKMFNYYESYYTDVCDPCTEAIEGKTIKELEAEDDYQYA